MTFSLSLLLLPNPSLHNWLLELALRIAGESNYQHMDAFYVICKHEQHVQQGSRLSFLKTAAACNDPRDLL